MARSCITLRAHGESRVAKAVLISAVPPIMVKTPTNPGGLPKAVFDEFQEKLAANRSQFYLDIASGPFYGYNRPGARSVVTVHSKPTMLSILKTGHFAASEICPRGPSAALPRKEAFDGESAQRWQMFKRYYR